MPPSPWELFGVFLSQFYSEGQCESFFLFFWAWYFHSEEKCTVGSACSRFLCFIIRKLFSVPALRFKSRGLSSCFLISLCRNLFLAAMSQSGCLNQDASISLHHVMKHPVSERILFPTASPTSFSQQMDRELLPKESIACSVKRCGSCWRWLD